MQPITVKIWLHVSLALRNYSLQATSQLVDEWRTLLDNALLLGLRLDDKLQSMLFLVALPSSWQHFITTQASIVSLAVETLIAQILQKATMHNSASSTFATSTPSAYTCNAILEASKGNPFAGLEVHKEINCANTTQLKFVDTAHAMVMLGGIVAPNAEINKKTIASPTQLATSGGACTWLVSPSIICFIH